MPSSLRIAPVVRRILAPLALLLVALPAAAEIRVLATAEHHRVPPGTEVRLFARVEDPERPQADLGPVRWEPVDAQMSLGDGVFRAPQTVLASRTFTLRATSTVDPSASAEVRITVDPAAAEPAWTPERTTSALVLDLVERLMVEKKESPWSHGGLPFLDVDTGRRYSDAKLASDTREETSPGPRQVLPFGLPAVFRWEAAPSGTLGALLSIRDQEGTRRIRAEGRQAATLTLESRVGSASLEVLTRDSGGLHSRTVPLDLQVRGLVPLAGHETYAGTDDGHQGAARFRTPSDLVRHEALGMVVSDAGAHTLRTFTSEGEVATLCGLADQPGFLDGRGAGARFSAPTFLALDEDGSILVADTGNHAIRRVQADGTVLTLAGTGQAGAQDGPAAQATFRDPRGLAVDPATGTVYVADAGNHRIRAISPAGQVTTLAGSGIGAMGDDPADPSAFLHLKGMVLYQGFLIVADGSTLRTVDVGTGTTATLVGAGGVPGFTPFALFHDVAQEGPGARLGDPHGLSLQGNDLLVTDRTNHAVFHLRLPTEDSLYQIEGPATLSALAGGPEAGTFRPGLLRDGYPGTLAERHGALKEPLGAAYDPQGEVVVTTGTHVALLSQVAAEREGLMDVLLPDVVFFNAQEPNQLNLETGAALDLTFHFRHLRGLRSGLAQPAAWMAEVTRAGQAGPERVAWAEASRPGDGGRIAVIVPEPGTYDLHVAWVMPDGQTYWDRLSLRVQGEPVAAPASLVILETPSVESKR